MLWKNKLKNWLLCLCVPTKPYVFYLAHTYALGCVCMHIYKCIYVRIIHVHVNTDQSGRRSVSSKYKNMLMMSLDS